MSIPSFSFHACDILEVEAVKMVATLLISVLVLHRDSRRGAFVPMGSIQRSLVVVMWGCRGPSGTRIWFVRLRFALGFVLQLSECSVSVWAWQGKLQLIVNFLQKGAFSRAKPICKIRLNLGSHFSLPSSFWELRDVFLEVPTQLAYDAS